ncbi:phage tail protein [Bacillus swezeyi]|uniref:phage tail protein n=1 Tax=Bacillus swezeyi TaxID=1925020 RepID=UPI002E20C3E6|nr:phage tail protein [Bacillus swezeyi]
MLPITDLSGNTEPVPILKNFTRTRKVNGEKTLTFYVLPTHEQAWGMVETQSIVEFDGEEYVIKKVKEKNAGQLSIKQVEAVHRFFDDMIGCQQYDIHNGSMTFAAALTMVFSPTPYTFNIIDSFYAETFENFGRDNCLSLFKKVLDRYGAEFRIEGKTVYLEREIGSKTDFQYRYRHNIKVIDKEINTNNLATYIRGYGGKPDDKGNYPIEREYTSPNAKIFGIIEADAVVDERITTVEGMDNRLKKTLIDEPELSITINEVDLRAAGHSGAAINEGDYGFIIYEPMGVDVEARIVEIKETFDVNFKPINRTVTISNITESQTDAMTRFSRTSKQFNRLMNGQETLPYNVLDEAVRQATEALQSAQTELVFDNGIIAVDPTNSNRLVLFNSAGLGVSSDGGQTFENAITYLGVNTNVLTAGEINTNNIKIIGKNDLFYWDGTALQAYDPSDLNRYVKLNSSGLEIAKGAISIQRDDGAYLIENGVPQFQHAQVEADPPFTSAGVEVYRRFWRTNSTTSQNCQVYTLKKSGRYLVVQVVGGMEDNGQSGTGTLEFVNLVSGEVFHSKTFSGTINESTSVGEYYTATIDLGIPDYTAMSYYLRIRTSSSSRYMYLRKLRAWVEG